jgi:hypothetical protein
MSCAAHSRIITGARKNATMILIISTIHPALFFFISNNMEQSLMAPSYCYYFWIDGIHNDATKKHSRLHPSCFLFLSLFPTVFPNDGVSVLFEETIPLPLGYCGPNYR